MPGLLPPPSKTLPSVAAGWRRYKTNSSKSRTSLRKWSFDGLLLFYKGLEGDGQGAECKVVGVRGRSINTKLMACNSPVRMNKSRPLNPLWRQRWNTAVPPSSELFDNRQEIGTACKESQARLNWEGLKGPIGSHLPSVFPCRLK